MTNKINNRKRVPSEFVEVLFFFLCAIAIGLALLLYRFSS